MWTCQAIFLPLISIILAVVVVVVAVVVVAVVGNSFRLGVTARECVEPL